MSSTAVVGAGMVGLAAAHRLAARGEDVVVFERDALPGGLASSFTPVAGADPLERFYHHVFKSDRRFIALTDELGIGDDLQWTKPGASCFYDGALHRLDGARSLLAFRPLSPVQRLRLAVALGILKASPSAAPFERRRSARWLRRVGGKRAYSIVFGPLFASKFGRHAESISLAWFWARIHDRTPALGYPRGGFARVYERLVDSIREHGGHVRLGAPITSVDAQQDGVRLTAADSPAPERFSRLVATVPLPALARIAPLDTSYVRRYAPQDSLAARCVVLALDRPLTGEYWINVCDAAAPFTVAVEHTALVDPARYGGRHLLYLGNYAPSFARRSLDDVVAEFTPYLQRMNARFSPDWIRDAWQFVASDAQPIVSPGYRERIPPYRTPLPNVYLANIYQVYPHDRGQNYAVELADGVVRAMDAPR